jgi:hypothetical protein
MSQPSSSSRASTLIGLIALVVLVVGLVYVLVEGIKQAPEVVGSFVTALGAVVAVVAGRIWEKRQELEQARRERIAPTYSRLVEVFYGAMGENAEVGEPEMLAFFHEWAQRVLLWGPEPVIRAFNDWRASLSGEDEEPGPEAGFGFERVLYAIRDDLGNKRGGLGQGDLLRVFINDLDEYIALHEARALDGD